MDFSHLDRHNNPKMVDVSEKQPTRRTARARGVVRLPEPVLQCLQDGDIHAPKGRVFHTAIIAGTMAAKQTASLIPFCHPVGLDRCDIQLQLVGSELIIECTCSVLARTGVEMEALAGVSGAALTVYDMCKALSHEMVIGDIRLLEKSGGKSGPIQEES